MKKRIKKVVLMTLLAASPALASGELLTLSLKGVSLNKDYTETVDGTTVDTERSDMGGKIKGYELGLSARVAGGALGGDKSEVVLSYQKLSGRSEYVGSIRGSGLGYGSYISETYNEITEMELGWRESRTTPYGVTSFVFGMGDRLWVRELSSIQIEDYKWKYGFVGMGVDFDVVRQKAKMGLHMRYQRAISPQMVAKEATDTTFDLGTTDGYRIEIPLLLSLSKNIELIASYRYDYWKINKSNVINGAFEPDSKTKNQLALVGVNLRW